MSRAAAGSVGGRKPILLLDVMDTIVHDPFYTHMPAFFGMTFDELLAAKHPTAWLEFEKGQITAEQFYAKFFKDGVQRECDGPALLQHMAGGYRYLEGMEQLLRALRGRGYEMHICSNYTEWYRAIDAKLQLSQYLPWTFVSCEGHMQGLRKPEPECFAVAARVLGAAPGELIFVDDREANVAAARAAGLDAVRYTGAEALRRELAARSIELP